MAAIEVSLPVSFPGTLEIGLTVDLSASAGLIGDPKMTLLDADGRKSAVLKYGQDEQISEIDLYEYGEGTISEIAIPADCEDYTALAKTTTDTETQETTETTTALTLAMAQKVIQLSSRAGQDYLPIGVEINMPWTADDGETEYDNPMILVAYRNMDKQGETGTENARVGIFRSKYATKVSLPFDAAETREAGTYGNMNCYYYGRKNVYNNGLSYTWKYLGRVGVIGQNISSWHQQYDKVFENGVLDKSFKIIQNGYSRWERSAWRKYLNSDAADGAWWSASHIGDTAPANIDSIRGYLAGLREEDLAAIAEVRVQTALYPTTGDGKWGEAESKLERFWLASVEEMNGVSPTNIDEGGAWEDYWEDLGMSQATNNATECRKVYQIEDTETAAGVRLRTCSQSSEGVNYAVNLSGQIVTSESKGSYRGIVCCAVG